MHRLRLRQTGPKYPVAVIQCCTHGGALTVYRPGHVPYGRVAILDIAQDGKELQRDPNISPANNYKSTLFEASVDAAAGHQWERAEFAEEGPWWNTQVRRLGFIERLLGLSPEQSEKQRGCIATALDVPLMDLRCGATAIEQLPGYRSRGKASLEIVQQMQERPCVLERLMVGGYHAGLWGVPYFWDRDAGCLRSPVLSVHGIRGSPGA